MTAPVSLRGMTWDHTRGFLPMVATAQRFGELHPEVRITWEKRSLKDFEDFPVELLAQDYDFVVLDHPCIGRLARSGLLLPLDEALPADFLADQAAHSVGASHASYQVAGHQWALATDAATPVAFWRADLMARHGLTPPATWFELLDLARHGHVEIPAAPINCLMNFYSLCLAAGETPLATPDAVASLETSRLAINVLRELIALCDPGCLQRNPIGSHNLISSAANSTVAYCPLAYGYSNYARAGYADHVLTFGPPPTWRGTTLATTLGGAGLALFARKSPAATAAALTYATYAASGAVQSTIYTHNGGQPGHRSAWLDAANNALTGNYFVNTLPVLDGSFLRPRFDGYIPFQAAACDVLHEALRGHLADDTAIVRINSLYRDAYAAAHSVSA